MLPPPREGEAREGEVRVERRVGRKRSKVGSTPVPLPPAKSKEQSRNLIEMRPI